MNKNTGVDFDRRCNKYRARLTRKGKVYHLGYFKQKKDACQKRQEAEENYNNDLPFEYLHSYSTTSGIAKIEGDDYLFILGLSPELFITSPQKSLLVAVLIQAIKDRLSDDPIAQEEARSWFATRERDTVGFSFLDVCDELLLKPFLVVDTIAKAETDVKAVRKLVGRRLMRGRS